MEPVNFVKDLKPTTKNANLTVIILRYNEGPLIIDSNGAAATSSIVLMLTISEYFISTNMLFVETKKRKVTKLIFRSFSVSQSMKTQDGNELRNVVVGDKTGKVMTKL